MDCAKCGTVVPPGRKTCPACGASVARAEAASSGVEALLAEANLARTRGQFDEAISAGMRILQIDPNNAAAHSLIANIYRDQGNYREALNWFKLAVDLNPGNEADKRKLDEMIDKVFQGVLAGEMRSSVKAMMQPPAAPQSAPAANVPEKRSGPSGVRGFLAGLQPTHIVIGTTVLAVAVVGLLVMFVHPKGAGGDADERREPRVVQLGEDEGYADSSAVATAPVTSDAPKVTPPAPDAVESGAGVHTIPGLPGIVVETNKGGATTPPPTTTTEKPAPKPAEKEQPTTPRNTGEVTPYSPLTNPAENANSVEVQADLLRVTMEGMLKTSRFPSKLDAVSIDPRTNVLTVKYTIPHTTGAAEAKKGLLYTGFQLIWNAAEQNKAFSGFTLQGYAYGPNNAREPSLALVADITPQHAEAAHNANDYRAISTFLTRPWWRQDLAGVSL